MAVDTTLGGDFARFFINGLLVVAGWTIVHRLSQKRDRDKSRREILVKSADSLIDTVEKLFADARNYHEYARNLGAEVSIKMKLQDISIQTASLSRISSNASELAICRRSMVELKKAITGKHFEDEHLHPLATSDRYFEELADAVLKAKRAFLDLKHSQFDADQI